MTGEFRVYDNKKKRYVTDDKMFLVNSKGELFHLEYDLFSYPDGIVEWATGLTDKNSNKIFEGDIVKHEDFIGMVVYSGDGFYIKDIPQRVEKSSWYILNHCEIIGNLHDNPELI